MVTDLRPPGNQSPLELFENPLEERGIGHAGIRGSPDWSTKRDMLPPLHDALGRAADRQSRLTRAGPVQMAARTR
ncbi:MAG: umuC [Arthrobacter sp.]|jgi:hypothetical protein|nr:umuC [Arthrobacter sp.]MCU1522247.1 umuC [Arthrobacter sp.]